MHLEDVQSEKKTLCTRRYYKIDDFGGPDIPRKPHLELRISLEKHLRYVNNQFHFKTINKHTWENNRKENTTLIQIEIKCNASVIWEIYCECDVFLTSHAKSIELFVN